MQKLFLIVSAVVLFLVLIVFVGCDEEPSDTTAKASSGQTILSSDPQKARIELAHVIDETGEGLIHAHAEGENLVVECEVFDESLNRRRFAQTMGLRGTDNHDEQGKLCGAGFSKLVLRGPTRAETRVLNCDR